MIIVCITGASGCIYGIRLSEVLSLNKIEFRIVVSDSAYEVIKQEIPVAKNIITHKEINKKVFPFIPDEYFLKNDNLSSFSASGSSSPDFVVICPCSMATLAGIANGVSDNLIRRSADVCIKERKKLIVVPRETPFSSIHLRNMLVLSDLGAVILPPVPAFYSNPVNVNDIIDFIVDRILCHLGSGIRLIKPYGEKIEQ